MSQRRPPRDRATEFAKNLAKERLEEHPAWPKTAFQLECEVAGIYQNISGRALQILHQEGEIEQNYVDVGDETRSYLARNENPIPDPEDEIFDAARRFEEFLGESGYFANLVTYVALCKIHEELNDYITGFDVLPEGPHPYILNNTTREPDGVVLLPEERVPVEVYNGGDYLGTNTRKYEQLQDLSSNPDGRIPTNPMLVNRLSDDDIKSKVRREMNGMVVDTNCLVACEAKRSKIEDALETLHLSSRVKFVPKVETANGVALDGITFDSLSTDLEDVQKIQPPSKMADAAEDLPDQFLERIRGGVQLQYVNSIYREGHERTKQDACFVLQEIYNILLREGGHDRPTALDRGWEQAIEKYSRLKSANQRKGSILDATRSLLNRLEDERMISKRNGEMHARKAEHPQQDLTFL